MLASAMASSLLTLCVVAPLSAQNIHITNAPFTATITSTHDGKTSVESEVARGSDGSTYEANKTADGRIFRIEITNVPENQRFVLYPSPPSYTYPVLPAQGSKVRTYSVDEYREQLQRMQASFAERPDRDKANGAHHHEVALGSKQEDGMTIFGSRDEVTLASGEKRIAEHWDSELGFFLRWTDTHPATGSIEIRTLTNLRRVEPDPKLFVIPAEYLPHSDPLLDARKVFIDNQTGIPEITDGAADAFKAWGRMAVTDRQDDADLVAVFTNVLMDGLETNEFPIKMGIYTPHSDTILFTSHLVKNMKYLNRRPTRPISLQE